MKHPESIHFHRLKRRRHHVQRKYDSQRVLLAHRWRWLENSIEEARTSIEVCQSALCSSSAEHVLLQECQEYLQASFQQKRPPLARPSDQVCCVDKVLKRLIEHRQVPGEYAASRCLPIASDRELPDAFNLVRDTTFVKPTFPCFTCPPLPPSHPTFMHVRSTMLENSFHPVLSLTSDAHSSTLRKAQGHRRYTRSRHTANTGKQYRHAKDTLSLAFGTQSSQTLLARAQMDEGLDKSGRFSSRQPRSAPRPGTSSPLPCLLSLCRSVAFILSFH